MTRTLCIANQKGGVGKTTTAVNLAAALAKSGAATLIVDLDPQCDATSGLGRHPVESHPLMHGSPIAESIKATDVCNLDLLPGCRSVRDIEFLTRDNAEQSARVREQLRAGFDAYDFVLIDCPPSLGPLTQMGLASATELFLPIHCEYFAMEGVAPMVEVVRDAMQQEGSQLQFGGVVLSMYDHTLELTREVEEQVRDFFGDIVFQTTVPRDVAVSEAFGHGKPVIDHDPRSRGSRAYVELCMEVLDRE